MSEVGRGHSLGLVSEGYEWSGLVVSEESRGSKGVRGRTVSRKRMEKLVVGGGGVRRYLGNFFMR